MHILSGKETEEVPRGELENEGKDIPEEYIAQGSDTMMVRRVKSLNKNTSCIALNYDILASMYGLDLKRNETPREKNMQDPEVERLPF